MNREKALSVQQAIADMDVPFQRRDTTRAPHIDWLARHLCIRNSQHPEFKRAQRLLLDLAFEEHLLRARDCREIADRTGVPHSKEWSK